MSNRAPPPSLELTQSKAAIVAAMALLANIIVASAVFFGVLPGIMGTGDAALAFGNVMASEQAFRMAICLLLLNFIADIFVFWALYYFLKLTSKSISFLALLFGLMHVVVGLLSIKNLTDLLHMANRAVADLSFNASLFHAQAATAIDAFHWAWQAGFILFGIHLLLRGYLFLYIKKWLGIALIFAAAGYLFDGFSQILISGYNTTVVTNYVGWLEILLPIWLLVQGRKAGIPPLKPAV
ncbi:MAG: DUF4386 domain-containing protein [Cystobacterineae bacterium]|nr:DUF4386 domain-containing protein [Cystobacterineae bacterium]